MPTQKPRFIVTVSEELFEKIEDFRFNNRYQNRNEAIVALLRLGLQAAEKEEKEKNGEG